MYVQKNYGLKGVLQFTGGHMIWLITWSAAVTVLYELTGSAWVTIPWLPVSLIGIAVAFYIGFKTANPTEGSGKPEKFGAPL